MAEMVGAELGLEPVGGLAERRRHDAGIGNDQIERPTIGDQRVGGGTNAVLEFVGPGAAALSVDERLAVANMAVEAGSETGIFPADEKVAEYLDERRLIGTTVELKPCRYRGLSVVVDLQARPLADTVRVQEDVAHALYTYLNPLVGGNASGPGNGWTFGRALNQG